MRKSQKKAMTKAVAALAAVAAAAAGILALTFAGGGGEAEEAERAPAVRKAKVAEKKVRPMKRKSLKERRAERKKPAERAKPGERRAMRPAGAAVAMRERIARAAAAVAEERASWTEEERNLAEGVEKALDDENKKETLRLAQQAAKSARKEIRAQAVDALRWFGKDAMPELAAFMGDSDEDVRSDALDAWTSALAEMENPQLKGNVLKATMAALADREQLDSLAMEMNDLPNSMQMDILLSLIDGKNAAAAEAAKEHYSFVTGEDWAGKEQADAWLRENPDTPEEEPELPAGGVQAPAAKK